GYLYRPDVTAERFVPHPFAGRGADQPGARLYRTGDVARFRSNGQRKLGLEFVGRVDQQVKLRGYRIELGEIEAVLRADPAVDEAIVLANAEQTGEKQLVVYVVRSKQAAETKSDLRTYLQAKLPDYMVPSRFVTLDALPLLPNGKVDRVAIGLAPMVLTSGDL